MAYWFLTDVGLGVRAPSNGGISRPPDGSWSTIATGDRFDEWADVDDGNGNPPAENDVIVVRSDMNETHTATRAVDFDNPVLVISSQVDAWQIYQKNSNFCLETILGTSSAAYMRAVSSFKWYRFKGIRIKSLSSGPLTQAGSRHLYTDCDLHYQKSNAAGLSLAGDGSIYVFRDTGLVLPEASYDRPLITTNSGATIILLGGECYRTRVSASTGLIEMPGSAGGSYFYAAGTDFSSNTANSNVFSTSSSAGRRIESLMYRCPMSPGWGITTPPQTLGACLRFVQCNSIYEDILELSSGNVEAVADVYHTNAQFLVDGITKISYQYLSNADCEQSMPLRYGNYDSNLWFEDYNDEAATKNTLRVHFVCEATDTLNDADIVIEAIYADSTVAYKSLYACHDKHAPYDVGVALPTETTSGNWTDTGSNNLAATAYQFDLALPNAGDGPVSWNFAIKKDNLECWVSPYASFV